MGKKIYTAKDNKNGPYLTKRILISAAKSGVRRAAKETMALMGYNIIAQDGWVVKKYASGKIERVSPLDATNINDIKLD